MTASQAMQDTEFQMRFQESQNYLIGLTTAFVEIANPLELYLFEPYCAMELRTGSEQWCVFGSGSDRDQPAFLGVRPSYVNLLASPSLEITMPLPNRATTPHLRPSGHRIANKVKTVQDQEDHARFDIRLCTS